MLFHINSLQYSFTLRGVNDDLIAESFLLEQRFLRLRSLSVRAIVAAVKLSSAPHAVAPADDHQSVAAAASISKGKDETRHREALTAILEDIAAKLDENAKLSEKECAGCKPDQFINPVQVVVLH